jgi:hypothetical protein
VRQDEREERGGRTASAETSSPSPLLSVTITDFIKSREWMDHGKVGIARSFRKLRDLNRKIFQNLQALTLTLDSIVAKSGPGVE